MGNCCGQSLVAVNEQCAAFALASEKVTLINTIEKWEEKLSEAKKDGKMIVVNFSASWCSPCRVVAPAYCGLADEYDSIVFLTVDVDELPEFSTSWDIKATPTFIFLSDGRQVDKLVGANEQELTKKTEALASSISVGANEQELTKKTEALASSISSYSSIARSISPHS